MSVNLLRRNSETPNIRNYDDSRMMRYATLGRSGIIKDYGEELALSQAGASTLHIGTGELIHQGWQVCVESGGEDIALDNRDAVEYYTVYVRINLAISSNQLAQILVMKGETDFPVITPGDDLTQNPSGTARLAIAHVYLEPSHSIFRITPLLEVLPNYPEYIKYAEQSELTTLSTSVVNYWPILCGLDGDNPNYIKIGYNANTPKVYGSGKLAAPNFEATTTGSEVGFKGESSTSRYSRGIEVYNAGGSPSSLSLTYYLYRNNQYQKCYIKNSDSKYPFTSGIFFITLRVAGNNPQNNDNVEFITVELATKGQKGTESANQLWSATLYEQASVLGTNVNQVIKVNGELYMVFDFNNYKTLDISLLISTNVSKVSDVAIYSVSYIPYENISGSNISLSDTD